MNSAYENTMKILQQKKKEQIGLISKYLADQCKLIEKHKDNIGRTLENSSKVFHQVKQIQSNLPHYESLCLTIKSLKQELKYLESTIDPLHVQFIGYKSSEPFTIALGNIEEVEDPLEVEINDKKNKSKNCSHTNKNVLQNSCLNDNSSNNIKACSHKFQEKSTPRCDDKTNENKSPDKSEKYLKYRQNINSRNHPKRMPWRKRNKSL